VCLFMKYGTLDRTSVLVKDRAKDIMVVTVPSLRVLPEDKDYLWL